MFVKRIVKRSFYFLGYDLARLTAGSHSLVRRSLLFKTFDISAVLDVGANVGQYAKQLRKLGFKGRILSFEPLSSAFRVLERTAQDDELWETYNHALGSADTHATINIAGNSYSSSLLEMLPSHVQSAPDSTYIGQEQITIKSLDSIFWSLGLQSDNVYLKIDAQGYENEILRGATSALEHIDTIQLELSTRPLYIGGLLFDEMHKHLGEMKYSLIGIEPGFTDASTGELLQFDGIYHRYP
jgi:FkbM family methyltransferase